MQGDRACFETRSYGPLLSMRSMEDGTKKISSSRGDREAVVSKDARCLVQDQN
jgi:hypothetical protein